jgi:hypothetical protein
MSAYDGTIEQAHLVWVLDLNGSKNPQRWSELYFGLNNHWKMFVIAAEPIEKKDEQLTLNELAEKYPPEKCRRQAPDFMLREHV